MDDRKTEDVFLSVVIPAYNEEERIAGSLEKVLAHLEGKPFASEIIVIDDGSRDGTARAAREVLEGRIAHRVVRREMNIGKGLSVKEGVLASSGDVVLVTDADLSTPIEELDKFLAALEGGEDVAVGSRALPDSDIQVRQNLLRQTMGKVFNRLVRLFVLGGIRDTQCGFKAFRRGAARDLFSRLETAGFAFDVEVLVLCRKLGYGVREVPVVWLDSRPSRVRLVRGSLGMLKELWRIRRTHGRRCAVDRQKKGGEER
jgi:dolichyl-phosphate beta-glucosyltransferase